MTDSLPKRVIDAIVDWVEDPSPAYGTAANLPPHGTVRYKRPRAIMPTDCPLLVVWLQNKSPDRRETETFHGVYSVGISWHLETVDSAKALIDNADEATDLMDHMEAIEQRVRELAQEGWDVAEAWEVTPGAVDYFRAGGIETALTEGYALQVVVRVEETG